MDIDCKHGGWPFFPHVQAVNVDKAIAVSLDCTYAVVRQVIGSQPSVVIVANNLLHALGEVLGPFSKLSELQGTSLPIASNLKLTLFE